MLTEFFIENNQVDVSENFSTLITYAIDDIKDFGSKNTSYSKTIILPGTARNNKIFGNIFDATVSNPYDPTLPNVLTNFNAAKSARCLMFQGNIQVFKGVMRITKIIIDKGVKEYEAAVVGELGGFVSSVGNGKLEDLDFSSYDLQYSIANIVSSWDNAPGSGVYFPLMDYGTFSTNKHDWDYHTFRPALYLKEYVDKIFAAANFTYDCALFSTARFKSIIVPHNKKQLVKQASNILDVVAGSDVYTEADGYSIGIPIKLPTHTTLGNFTANVDSTVFTFVPTTPLTGIVTFQFTANYTKSSSLAFFSVQIQQNGVDVAVRIFGSSITSGSYTFTIQTNITLSHNDTIEVSVDYQTLSGTFSINFNGSNLFISNGANSLVPVGLGETIPLRDAIPQNILQIDFFSSILKLFNLYVYDDKFDERKLKITPYVDFYDTSPITFIDWTYKLNRDKPITLTPLSELNSRYYEFKYKQDNDYYNEDYRKRYNENYGDNIHDSQFEFANDKETVQLIFSGTPLVGYLGEDKVYGTIFKKSGDTEESIDANIRILQTKKITGVSSWDIVDGSTTVIGSYTDYGYAGHLDDPDIPGNDLNFGVPKELYFTLVSGNLSINQFNVYYSPYMAEITDKDSKLLSASFRLTPKDIAELDFSKFVYIDGSVFRINKISDYNASTEDECGAELLKALNTIY